MFFVFLGLAVANLLFLAAWMVLGFQVGGDPTRAQWHQVGGLSVCVLTLFVHALTFVYFLGTGLAVKEAVLNWGIDQDFVRQTRRFKLKVYPIAMVSIALIVTTGILGGAVRSASVTPVVHRGFAVAATLSSLLAFVVALKFILRNGFMLGLIRGDIERIRERARDGAADSRAPQERPLLLRHPEDVRKPSSGFLWHRALLFLALSTWLLYAYLEWWFPFEGNLWLPFAAWSAACIAASVYLRVRHPLPADVDF